jgi:methionine biosynthesis protein MetW
MPMSRALPDTWYETPNIHLCTVADFEELCDKLGIAILQRAVVDHAHRSSLGLRLLPGLLGEICLYRLKRR